MIDSGSSGPTHSQMRLLLAMVGIFGLAAVGLPFFFGAPDRWEYRIEAPSDYALTEELDGYGRDGWEVVSARRATSGSGYATMASYEFILKRRRSALAFLLPSPRASSVPSAATVPVAATQTTQPQAPDLPSGYQVIDRQGSHVFAVINQRFAHDTMRIRQFGGNLCGDLRPCIVRFWSERPRGALRVPLSADQQSTQVAEFSRGRAPDPGTASILR
jgi:hypothetical protein